MASSVLVFLTTIAGVLALSAARCRFSTEQLPAKIEKYYKCLSIGFDTSLEGCWRLDVELVGKKARKCAELEKYLVRCGFKCQAPEDRVATPAVEGEWAVAAPGALFDYNMDVNEGLSIIANATYGYHDAIRFILSNSRGQSVLDVYVNLYMWKYGFGLWYNSTNCVGIYEKMHGNQVAFNTEQVWMFTVTRQEGSRYRVTAVCNEAKGYAIDAVLHESMRSLEGYYTDQRNSSSETQDSADGAWDDVITNLKFVEFQDTASDFYISHPRERTL